MIGKTLLKCPTKTYENVQPDFFPFNKECISYIWNHIFSNTWMFMQFKECIVFKFEFNYS